MGNSRKKPLLCLKLCVVLSSVMKSRAILVHSAWEASHPSAQRVQVACYLPITHSSAVLVISDCHGISALLLSSPSCYLLMARRARVVMLAIWICQIQAITLPLRENIGSSQT